MQYIYKKKQRIYKEETDNIYNDLQEFIGFEDFAKDIPVLICDLLQRRPGRTSVETVPFHSLLQTGNSESFSHLYRGDIINIEVVWHQR